MGDYAKILPYAFAVWLIFRICDQYGYGKVCGLATLIGGVGITVYAFKKGSKKW